MCMWTARELETFNCTAVFEVSNPTKMGLAIGKVQKPVLSSQGTQLFSHNIAGCSVLPSQ